MGVYEDYYSLCGVNQHKEFENYLEKIILDKEKREKFYKGLLKINNDVSIDLFKPYFEEYAAERKSFKQEYTPDSVAQILATLTRDNNKCGYAGCDYTAGTGTLIIAKWWDDMMCETPFTYAPHRYLYRADELSDSAIIYLIHNLAIRGMNAIVVHGDSLNGIAKQVYFIQNSQDDYLRFSDINVLPHSEEIAHEFGINKWIGEEIDHIESSKVTIKFAYPSKKMPLEVDYNTKATYKEPTYYKNRIKLKEVCETIERSKKNKIYPKGAIIIQISATRGQVGLLKSSGNIGSQYAVVIVKKEIDPYYAFLWLQMEIPKFFHRVQEGLNVKIEEIGNCAFPIMERRRKWYWPICDRYRLLCYK